MAVKIRLRRMGARNRPFFRIVVADGRSPKEGRFIETLGWYDPMKDGKNYSINMDRYTYWKDCGALSTQAVTSIARKETPLENVVTEEEMEETQEAETSEETQDESLQEA